MGFDQSPVSISADSTHSANCVRSDDSSDAISCVFYDGSVEKTASNPSAGSIRHSSLNFHGSIDRSTSQEELCDTILISSSEDSHSGVIKQHQIVNPMIKPPDTAISGRSIQEPAIKQPIAGFIMRKSSSFSAVKAQMLKLDNLSDYQALIHDETAQIHHQNHANPSKQRLVPHRISTGDLINYPNDLDRNPNYHPRSSFSGMATNSKINTPTTTTNYHHNYSHFRYKQMITSSSKWDDAEKWLLNRSPPHHSYYIEPRSVATVTGPPPLFRSIDHSVMAFSSSASSSSSSSSSESCTAPWNPKPFLDFSCHGAESEASSAIAGSGKVAPVSPAQLNKQNLGGMINGGKSDSSSRKNKLVKSMASIAFSDHPPPLQPDDHGNQRRILQVDKLWEKKMGGGNQVAAAHVHENNTNNSMKRGIDTWRSPAHVRGGAIMSSEEPKKQRVVVIRPAGGGGGGSGGGAATMMRDASTEVSPRCSVAAASSLAAAAAAAPRQQGQITHVPSSAATPRRENLVDPKESRNLLDSAAAAAASSKQGDIRRHLFGAEEKQRPHQSSDVCSRVSIRVSKCGSDPNPNNNNNNNAVAAASPASHYVHAQAVAMSTVSPALDSLIVSTCWLDHDEAERFKHSSKFAREAARIDAWEKHQKAKAEAELKKLEMKLERLRSRATEKIMNRVAAARVRAAEMRAAMSARQAEQLTKSLDRGTANHHQNHQNHHQNQNQFLNIRSRGSNYFSESLGVCFPAILP